MEIFTGSYADNLEEEGDPNRNRSMQDRLNSVFNALTGSDRVALERVGFAIVAVEPGDRLRAWAGHRHTEMHFSGSMVKILAMYGMQLLRFFAKQLLHEVQPGTADQLFARLRTEFDQKIVDHTPSPIKTQVPPPEHSKWLPSYPTMFEIRTDAAGTPVDIDFSPAYFAQITSMLHAQRNAGAANCIHGLGYGFMNGKCADDGFFTTASGRGIWLAGDYLGQWKAARISSANDGPSAQATTAIDMARLMTRLFDGSLECGKADDLFDMLAPGGRSWLHQRGLWPAGQVGATHVKLGIGPLKPNSAGVINQVVSEAAVVRDSATETDFVVIWQNLLTPGEPTKAQLEPVSFMIESTIDGFVPTS